METFFKKYGSSLLIGSLIINLFVFIYLFDKRDMIFQRKTTVPNRQISTKVESGQRDSLFNEINPEKGYEINSVFGDLGKKMIELGVIDYAKFKAVYEKSGEELTQEEVTILTKGSKKKVKITRENSHFLLNFFWAVGLANKTSILSQGQMTSYGKDKVGNFASTGGWTLGKADAMAYYAKTALIPLTTQQEALVKRVADNVYRPCCNNPTSFPDCNHGMALLGLLELMAADGASEKQMFEAAKYFNAFWFPGNYYDLALYFQKKENKRFQDIDGKVLLSKAYSSGSGWQTAKQWLTDQGVVKEPPSGSGGGCGV